jgi:hypothetical protein
VIHTTIKATLRCTGRESIFQGPKQKRKIEKNKNKKKKIILKKKKKKKKKKKV